VRIEEAAFDKLFSFYSNPNNGSFITETSNPVKIEVFNSIGKMVANKNLTAGKNQLNLENSDSGIYFISITVEYGNRTAHKMAVTK
jgi:hypothetical protein